MKGVSGFVCSVRVTDGLDQVQYFFPESGESRILRAGEVFTGYFRNIGDDGTGPQTAVFVRYVQVDPDHPVYIEGEVSVFKREEVAITLLAKRTPESMNRFLSEPYRSLPCWYRANTPEGMQELCIDEGRGYAGDGTIKSPPYRYEFSDEDIDVNERRWRTK